MCGPAARTCHKWGPGPLTLQQTGRCAVENAMPARVVVWPLARHVGGRPRTPRPARGSPRDCTARSPIGAFNPIGEASGRRCLLGSPCLRSLPVAGPGARSAAALLLGGCRGARYTAEGGYDAQGWSPLHSAVSAGHDDVVQRLLSVGADVAAQTSGGQTPLHYAVRSPHSERPSLTYLKHTLGVYDFLLPQRMLTPRLAA